MIFIEYNNKSIAIKMQSWWQKIIDYLDEKKTDTAITILYAAIGIYAVFNLFEYISSIKDPIGVDGGSNFTKGLFILLSLFNYFFSLLGEKHKKPYNRIKQFIYVITCISIFSLCYIANVCRSVLINILLNIHNIDVIPPDLIIGNLRIFIFFIPIMIVLPINFLTLNILKDEKSKKKLREMELDWLLPTVYPSDDTTIDVRICEDLETGEHCIVPEKMMFSHMLISGSTGSGKSSSVILPMIEQLFYKKSYLTYKLKEITYSAMKSGIARIKIPVTNKWFNENFDIDLIEVAEGKEKDFIKKLDKYIIGIRDNNKTILNETFVREKELDLEALKNKDYHYEINVRIFKGNMEADNKSFTITKGNEDFELEFDNYGKIISSITERDIYIDENTAEFKLKDNMGQILKMKVIPNEGYKFNILITSKGDRKIIPKNLGLTVIAPDGELIKKSIEIGKQYGIKVHKIDPFREEIRKGDVAKFNPLKGDSPEKIGDIVASILVSMEIGQSTKVNPYFTNASVRAVRNLVILLKVAHPIIYGKDPTLDDVLSCLNDFNRVGPYVDVLENDAQLRRRWGSVIDYFKSSFLDSPKDNNDNDVKSSNIGSQKKKTLEAVSGIINQLDNLLGREEIRTILCDTEESIDLKEVLSKGQCIAISTRQGDLGPRLGRAFALFFILSLQNEILSRYAENENPEIPHYLIIDEFPMYLNENTETFFTFARKYKCSVNIVIQDIGQLRKISDEFAETLLSNIKTKLILPKPNLEDRKYWSAYFGNKETFDIITGITTNTISADTPSYTENIRGSIKYERNVTEDELNNLAFQTLYYIYTNNKGREIVGKGKVDFVETKPEPFMVKQYNFEDYAISESEYMEMIKQEQAIKDYKKKKEEKQSVLMIVNGSDENRIIHNKNSNNLYEAVEDDKNDNDKISSDVKNNDTPSNAIDLVIAKLTEEKNSLYTVDNKKLDNNEHDNNTPNNDIINKSMENEKKESNTKFKLNNELKGFFMKEE